MPTTIAHMTKKEFTEILSSIVEQKLIELYGDPDEGLVIKERLRKRLIQQKKAVANGERGSDIASVFRRIGLG
jgi:hypothetical protein